MKPQQQVCDDTVLIPKGDCLIDKSVRFYLFVASALYVRVRF